MTASFCKLLRKNGKNNFTTPAITTRFFALPSKERYTCFSMLQLSSALKNLPVMSLRTGTQVAVALAPIINPNNLKIEGFYCQDTYHKGKHGEIILINQDIRDIIPQGIVVNDYDVLTEPSELVRLQDILRMRFEVIGKQVTTTRHARVGKVEDYSVELSGMYIQKLYVSRPLYRNFSGGNLGVDRTQIVEITDKKIIIQDLLEKVPAGARAVA